MTFEDKATETIGRKRKGSLKKTRGRKRVHNKGETDPDDKLRGTQNMHFYRKALILEMRLIQMTMVCGMHV